jgi:NTE family protein
MGQVGLVLGAGGLVGQAYHAGVLAALEEAVGWDPRTADRIVGSSAGSLTGALLRLGVSAQDLAAFLTGGAVTPAGAELFGSFGEVDHELPPFSPTQLVTRAWRPPSARYLARTARRPWAFRPLVAAATMLPSGRFDLQELTAALDTANPGGAWPEGLLICAARRADGHRVVFGRPTSPVATLSQAVAASCAIPGYFAPVRIDGEEYFDGGVHSPSNAAVLRGEGLDLVIVVSPMSVHGRATRADAAWRLAVHRRLSREVRRLRAEGTAVVVFEPERPTLRAMGLNAMSDERVADVVRTATQEVADRLTSADLRDRLRLLEPPSPRAA